MLKIIRERLRQGHRTGRFPAEEPTLPERFRGAPRIEPGRCGDSCRGCVDSCPFGAIELTAAGPRLDLGLCIFCGDCAAACPHGALSFSRDYRLAARRREELLVGAAGHQLAEALTGEMRRLFGRSLKLRQVSAGGCNACEADLNVLATPFFDLARFGINFVASPRHADAIVVTGPVSRNMRTALLQTYEAVPAPKAVIAVGACAISGGPFQGSPEVSDGLESILPVDLFIPGCPPHPMTNLHALLTFFK